MQFYRYLYWKLITLFFIFFIVSSYAAEDKNHFILLHHRPGFLRLSYDNLSMPNHMKNMGLLGFTYYADITPEFYAGIGGYGSITGEQGGLFILGLGAGIHKQFFPNWWADTGIFLGGGGGRSSWVGGGLMIKPYIGLAYSWNDARIGLHYSYINFPSGSIHSKQIGVDLDLPFNFYYVSFANVSDCLSKAMNIRLCDESCLGLQRNDFAIVVQAYNQKAGTKSVLGVTQDGTIKLVGAELDHYLTENGLFWWVKTSGALGGIPNGYMDLIGGLGYHFSFFPWSALVPQLGIGIGGGANVDTGGGILVQPQLGMEIPLANDLAARLSGGYLWAPGGRLKAVTATGAIIYHLDLAAGNQCTFNSLPEFFITRGWRVNVFNQTYLHPQRVTHSIKSNINLIALQFDQFINPLFFLTYQAASAYNGDYAGGYATGLVGAGVQTPRLINQRIQFFTEFLIGAGGGGNLALSGGSIIEPVVGMHFAFSPAIGLQASVAQIKALRNDLNVTVFNFGVTVSFGTLNCT